MIRNWLLMIVLVAGMPAAHANVDPNPPRLSTPPEIAGAALGGQIDALRQAGFEEACLMDIEISGERCIESCVSRNLGFYVAVALEHPTCKVVGCYCEDELGREITPDE